MANKNYDYICSLIVNMKNYSFSNIAGEESFSIRKSNDFNNLYRHSELKNSDSLSRIEEIKRKYDTPSRRERIQSMKKSREVQAAGRGNREDNQNAYQVRPTPNFGSNALKESYAVNRLEKSTLKNDYERTDFLRGGDFRRSGQKQNQYESYLNKNREQEEIIMSKMRGMKESMMNNEYNLKGSINGRSSIRLSKHSEKQYGPRIDTIDKISSKIKHILSSLSEHQKYPKINSQLPAQETSSNNKESAFFGIKGREGSQAKNSYENHLQRNSDFVGKYTYNQRPPAEDPRQPHKASVTEQDKLKYEPTSVTRPPMDYQRPNNRDYSVNRLDSYVKDYSVTRPTKQNQEVYRTPTILKNQTESKLLKGSRSRSQIDSFKKSTLAHNDNGDTLKSGKKLNDEIYKIQRKIQEFEKEKRKLNIEFTPFKHKNKSSANLNADSQPQNVRFPSRNIDESRERQLQSNNIDRSSSNDYKFKSYLNKAASYQERYQNFNNKPRDSLSKDITKNTSVYDNAKPKYGQERDFELKIQQIEIKTVRLDHNVQNDEQENFNSPQPSYDEAAIKKRTDEGIQYRRKILQGEDEIIKTESLKKLVELFCEQVKLDENLRNLKIWLETCFQSDKFSKLLRYLQKQGIKLSLKQCQTIFTVDESQHNPFFSVQGFGGSYQALASAFSASDKHWKSKIQHKFERTSLLTEGFTSQKIDLQRKNFIELQDLVRFLNIQSGTFYRNRDLFLIFHRFTHTQQLNFQAMLSEVSA